LLNELAGRAVVREVNRDESSLHSNNVEEKKDEFSLPELVRISPNEAAEQINNKLPGRMVDR